MEILSTHAQRITKMGRANRNDHEFLYIKRIIGMGTAIHDVHHRRWQQMRVNAPKIAPERHLD